jgi:hypothetical protein
VLIVDFHLWLLGARPFPDCPFQRARVLTTSFWSGIRGFRVKLWVVDSWTKTNLSIRQGIGSDNVQAYVDALVRI